VRVDEPNSPFWELGKGQEIHRYASRTNSIYTDLFICYTFSFLFAWRICSEYWFTSVGTTPCIYLSIEERVSRFWQEKVTDCGSYSLWSWHNTLKYFAWHVSLLFVRAQGIYCKAAMIVVYRTSLHDSGHAVIVQGFLSSCGCCRSSCIHITNSCKEPLWHHFLLHHLSQLLR